MWVLRLVLAIALIAPLGGCSCPTALLEGRLIPDGSGGLMVQPAEGAPMEVVWPDWHGVHLDADTDRLVVTGPLGVVVAREGDHVRLGGGGDPNGSGFKACGGVAVDDAP